MSANVPDLRPELMAELQRAFPSARPCPCQGVTFVDIPMPDEILIVVELRPTGSEAGVSVVTSETAYGTGPDELVPVDQLVARVQELLGQELAGRAERA